MREIIKLSEAEFLQSFCGYDIYKVTNDKRKSEKEAGLKASIFACCNMRTKKIFVYSEFFRIPKECQKAILLHEICHIKFQTDDEEKCDQFAIDHLENGKHWVDRTRQFTKIFIPIVRQELSMV